jgi:hypothetical protein
VTARLRSNAEEVAERFRRLARATPDVARDEARAVAAGAVPNVEAATPVDTGDLRDAWAVEDTAQGARLANRSRYAGFQLGLSESAVNALSDAADERPPFTDQLRKEVP